jgi:hypothetical protein
MPSAHVRRLDPSGCVALIRALGDTPRTVIAVHQLRHNLCEAHVEVGSGHSDAREGRCVAAWPGSGAE